jgi:hypothetical protein
VEVGEQRLLGGDGRAGVTERGEDSRGNRSEVGGAGEQDWR